MKKKTKEQVNYRDHAVTKQCKDCSMFVKPMSCTAVSGAIYPSGHCRLWENKKLPVEK